jgi:hypothetical protein
MFIRHAPALGASLLGAAVAMVIGACGDASTPARPADTLDDPCTSLSETAFGRGENGEFCITWDDSLDIETGFRITLNYGNGAEVFVYETAANTSAFFPPDSDVPISGDIDLQACLARAGRFVTVEAILPEGDQLVASGAMNAECADMSR